MCLKVKWLRVVPCGVRLGPYSLNQFFENWLPATVMLLCASYTEAPDASGK